MSHAAIWSISALTIAGILIRPRGWPEYVWACLGAILLLAFRLITPAQAAVAAQKGMQVYLFLAGMLLLSEMARRQGLFDWLAVYAVNAARGSRLRLFSLIYLVGIVVTALLSNDATAVVLTPAVYAAVRRAGGAVLPYLAICAFVANAASFVLPFSNPANLVIFRAQMPPLADWLRFFALPAALAIAATYVGLRWMSRNQLAGKLQSQIPAPVLSPSGAVTGWGILATAVVLVVASALGTPLGLPTLVAALAVLCCVLLFDRTALMPTFARISWGILPLVAGLFVVVGAVSMAGGDDTVRSAVRVLESWPAIAGSLGASFGTAVVCNIANNLPVGVLAGSAAQEHISHLMRNALAIGIDLGPNFSVTGSLATILWLIALRREGVRVSFFTFLKYGLAVNSPAMVLATAAVIVGS